MNSVNHILERQRVLGLKMLLRQRYNDHFNEFRILLDMMNMLVDGRK